MPDAVLGLECSDEQLADLVRLQAHLNGRWARDALTGAQAETMILSPQEQMLVTKQLTPEAALERLASLPRATYFGPCSTRRVVRKGQTFLRVTWANLAESQNWDRPNPGQDAAPSKTPPPPPLKTPPKEEAAAGAATTSSCSTCGCAHPRGAHPMPSTLPADQVDALRRWAESKGYTDQQLRHAVQVVRDWAAAAGRRKSCWPATIRNAMRTGWALPKPGNGSASPTTISSAQPDPKNVRGTPAYCRARGYDLWEFGHDQSCPPDCTKKHPRPAQVQPPMMKEANA